ncbi:MAG: glycosyltransferase [Nanoarchaeota archaeon]
MSLINIIKQYSALFADRVTSFFAWYNSTGRNILDFLHNIFDNTFKVLLIITVVVSALYLIMTVYAVFHKQKKKEDEECQEELPFVTVQIPTFNELVAIRCAESCLKFDYPKDKYEIIIGDDSNRSEVSAKITEFAQKHDLVKVTKRKTNEGYKPGNLNNMLKHSKGEVLVVFDSDFVPEPDFLSRIVRPFMKDKNIAGVQARWKLMNPGQNMVTSLGATIIYTCHYVTLPFIHTQRKISFLCGSAEAVRRSTLIELGGWESGNLTEDIEFSLRLLERGYKIEYIDSLDCDGEVPHTLRDLYRQQMRWAYGVIYSWKNHFFTILKSKKIGLIDKTYMAIFLSGYLISVLLAALFITGTLSLITHAPAPVEWEKLSYELTRNVLLTSGLLIAGCVALLKANKSKLTLKMIASSFSYGLVVTYYVNVGIIKAIAKVPMEWYMLNKHGNKLIN